MLKLPTSFTQQPMVLRLIGSMNVRNGAMRIFFWQYRLRRLVRSRMGWIIVTLMNTCAGFPCPYQRSTTPVKIVYMPHLAPGGGSPAARFGDLCWVLRHWLVRRWTEEPCDCCWISGETPADLRDETGRAMAVACARYNTRTILILEAEYSKWLYSKLFFSYIFPYIFLLGSW